MTVAGRGLGHLLVESQDVAEQEYLQGWTIFQRLTEGARAEPQHSAGGLDHGLGVAAVTAKQKGQADHALGAD